MTIEPLMRKAFKKDDPPKTKKPLNCKFYKSIYYPDINDTAHMCHCDPITNELHNGPFCSCVFGICGTNTLAKGFCKHYQEKETKQVVISESVLKLNAIDDKVVELETIIESIYKTIDELKSDLMKEVSISNSD